MAEDSAYPWDEESRKNVLVFKLLKSQLDLNATLIKESAVYHRLTKAISNIPGDIKQQLNGHSEFIEGYTQCVHSNMPTQDYKLLRRNYIKYGGKLDSLVS